MIAAVLSLVLGATEFVVQDLPGLSIGSNQFPASEVPANVTTADVNRDGQTDLVLPEFVRLQTAGRFPDSASVRMPELGEFNAFHIENDLFYGFGNARVACYRFLTGRWWLYWEAPVPPDPSGAAIPLFQDLDGDGQAELLVPGAQFLHVYRLNRGVRAAGDLDVYPPIRPMLEPVRDLWNARTAPQSLASAARRFRLAFAGQALTVQELLQISPHAFDLRSAVFRIEAVFGGHIRATRTGEHLVETFPRHMSPCFLDPDEVTDFAGTRRATASASPWTPPLTDISVTLGNRGPQIIRTKAHESNISVADFDADGDADFLVETNNLFDGPPREVLLNIASKRRVLHEISVHVQEVDGNFSESPREVLRIPLEFDQPLAEGSRRWIAYRSRGLSSTQGDYNGDRRADIAVWSSPSKVQVFLNHEGLFHEVADAELPVSGQFDRIAAVDVDGDRKSDIVLVPIVATESPARVFLSR